MAQPLSRARRLAGLALASALAACGGKQPPSADRPPPPPPDLTARAVMLLPVQGAAAPAGLDEELAFWLGERAPDVKWKFPPDLERALARSPALDVRPRALAVSIFRRAEVERIGDPLFGDLRRLGALVDARYAILPVAGGYVHDETAGGGRVEIALAVVDTIGGAVLWFGVIGGEHAPEGSPSAAASAAQAVARTLFP